VLGNDPEEFLAEVEEYAEAGYTHLYWHQVGPDQDAFLKFAKSELFPRL
jgi:coenzyme F420-dependent glucose-6-phosphate dehydrogenase